MLPNIALSGRSGSGKTLVASFLSSQYGYYVCSSGAINREICTRLFGNESKQILNQVTDAMKAIDPLVYIKATLKEAPRQKPLVFDSMRYQTDFEYIKKRNFICWQLQCPLKICVSRLHARKQSFVVGRDDVHPSETELLSIRHDFAIDSEEDSLCGLYAQVEETLLQSKAMFGPAR